MIPRTGYRRTIFFLCFALLAPILAHAGPIDRWYWRSPQPTGNDLNGVAWGHGRYVAVGEHGVILTSRHGEAWHPRRSDLATWNRHGLQDVAWGNGRFVAVGEHSAIRVSTDGVSWVKRNPGYQVYLYGVAWCLDRFLAVGSDGDDWGATVLSSPDGKTWSKVEAGVEGERIYDVAYGNGVFVAVGLEWINDEEEGIILTSPDGKAWSRAASPVTSTLYGLAFGGGKFVAVGRNGTVLTSADGVAWEDFSMQSHGPDDFADVSFGGGRFVAVGVDRYGSTATSIVYSPDGTNWTPANLTGYGNFLGVTWGVDGFIAVGESGRVDTSPDGITWVKRGSRVRFLGETVWAGGRFLSIGRGGVSQSVDGRTWEQERHPELATVRSVTYGNGLFVAGGGGSADGFISTSPDGHVWTTAAVFPFPITKVRALGGIFLALGNIYFEEGSIYFSLDGTHWQRVLHTVGWGRNYWDLAYGNGAFVVSGNFHSVVSWDAATWFEYDLPTYVNALAYGNGVFVGGGNGICYSRDGRNWEYLADPGLYPGDTITFAHGWFASIDSHSGLSVSQDGMIWNRNPLWWPDYYYDYYVVPGPNSFLAIAADGGIVLESGTFDQGDGVR